MEDQPVLDLLSALDRVDGDRGIYRELVDLFCAELEDELPQLEAAVAAGQLQQAEDLAHSLKGALGNVGGAAGAEAAKQIEFAAREARLNDARSALTALKQQMEALMAAWRSEGIVS